jgi:hypothetical protein
MMVNKPHEVRKELRRRVGWGYDPTYDWESCCASSVNYLVLSEAEFNREKARAVATRGAGRRRLRGPAGSFFDRLRGGRVAELGAVRPCAAAA